MATDRQLFEGEVEVGFSSSKLKWGSERCRLSEPHFSFLTDTGSVNATLPANSSFHVDASTDTGSINSDFTEVNVQKQDVTGSTAHGDVGSNPGATVTLKTNTGSINLQKG